MARNQLDSTVTSNNSDEGGVPGVFDTRPIETELKRPKPAEPALDFLTVTALEVRLMARLTDDNVRRIEILA